MDSLTLTISTFTQSCAVRRPGDWKANDKHAVKRLLPSCFSKVKAGLGRFVSSCFAGCPDIKANRGQEKGPT